jgi:hypothetical protein
MRRVRENRPGDPTIAVIDGGVLSLMAPHATEAADLIVRFAP